MVILLKDVILSFQADMRKLEEIDQTRQCQALAYGGDKEVDKAINVLSANCALLKRYPLILTNILKFMEKRAVTQESEVILNINKLGPDTVEWYPVGGIGTAAFLLSQSCEDFTIGEDVIIEGATINNFLTKLGIGICVVSAMALYPYFKEYYEKYTGVKEKVYLQKDHAYKKGLLLGFLGQKGEPERDFQEEKCEHDLLNKWNLHNILLFSIPFWYGFWPALLLGPYLVSWPAIGATALYLIFLVSRDKEINRKRKEREKENAKKLFDYNLKLGQWNGYKKYLEMNQLQDQSKNEQVFAEQSNSFEKPNPFRGLFGSIATYSKNLFAGLMSCIPKYQ